MSDFTYETMCATLPEEVPELRAAYEEEVQWWRDRELPPHVVYGNVLNPFLTSLLLDGNVSEPLHRIFSRLEMLALHSDIRVREVLAVTILERIAGEGSYGWGKALPLMGPATREIGAKVERHVIGGAVLGEI